MEYGIQGAEQLAKLAKLLKQAPKELNREVSKGLGKAAEKAKREPLAHVDEFLPKRGGLAKRVARSKLKHRVRKGNSPKVTIEAVPSHTTLRDPQRVDRGRIKHPAWGMAHSRNPWVLQEVKPGWFSEPIGDSKDVFQRDLIQAIDGYIAQIERQL